MDAHSFDRWTVALAQRPSRRITLRVLTGGLLGGLLAQRSDLLARAQRPDSDGDQLFDDDELRPIAEGGYGTDPHNADTDGDQANDGLEIWNRDQGLGDPDDPLVQDNSAAPAATCSGLGGACALPAITHAGKEFVHDWPHDTARRRPHRAAGRGTGLGSDRPAGNRPVGSRTTSSAKRRRSATSSPSPTTKRRIPTAPSPRAPTRDSPTARIAEAAGQTVWFKLTPDAAFNVTADTHPAATSTRCWSRLSRRAAAQAGWSRLPAMTISSSLPTSSPRSRSR